MAATGATGASKSPNLCQRLLAVQKAVGSYLRKDQQGHQFQYVGSSQVLGVIREAMDENGLILSVSVTGHNLVTKWSVGDSKEHLTELDILFAWINVDDPADRMEWHGYGQGLDTGEKGVGKALTYAEKYGLLKFFHIATDKDDPDGFQQRVDAAKPPERTIGVEGERALVALVGEVASAQSLGNPENAKLAQAALIEVVKEFKSIHGAARTAQLTESQGATLRAMLEAMREKALQPLPRPDLAPIPDPDQSDYQIPEEAAPDAQ